MTEYKELAARLRADADKGSREIGTFERVSRSHSALLITNSIQAASAIEALEAERDARNEDSDTYKAAMKTYFERALTAEARCKRLEEALRPFATGSVDVSGTAVILDSLSARDARDAARLALQENANGG